jgi:flagellar protein FliJ
VPKFKFRMATLLKLRESDRDERRSQLAQAFRAEELIEQEQERLDGELAAILNQARAAAGPGEVNVDQLLEAQRFEILLMAQKQQLARQREIVKEEIERRRQALVEANREVQVLENLREKQRERWRDEENRQDVKRLDEAAQTRRREEEA